MLNQIDYGRPQTMTLSNAERSKRKRDKKQREGKVRGEYWVRPKHVAKMKKLEKELNDL